MAIPNTQHLALLNGDTHELTDPGSVSFEELGLTDTDTDKQDSKYKLPFVVNRKNIGLVVSVLLNVILLIVLFIHITDKNKTNQDSSKERQETVSINSSDAGFERLIGKRNTCYIPFRRANNDEIPIGIDCIGTKRSTFNEEVNQSYIVCKGKQRSYHDLRSESQPSCNGSAVTCCQMARLCNTIQHCADGICACVGHEIFPSCFELNILIPCVCYENRESISTELNVSALPACSGVFHDELEITCTHAVGQHQCVCGSTIEASSSEQFNNCFHR